MQFFLKRYYPNWKKNTTKHLPYTFIYIFFLNTRAAVEVHELEEVDPALRAHGHARQEQDATQSNWSK